MTETETSTSKRRRTLSAEQLAKMKAGRERAAAARRKAKKEAEEAAKESAESEPEDKPLVRTSSAAIREVQEQRTNGGRSLEDVAQRHVARDAGLADDPAEAPEDEYNELPASSFHGPNDAVPAPAVRPERREQPTLSVRDAGDDAINYIQDVMREWGGALDAGTCYIRVERKKPTRADGLMIQGTQRPITQSITEQEFVDIYGGGTYDLVVYGPSQLGHRLTNDGRTRHKRLSPVITISIPLSYPPNIDAAVLEGEEDDMQQQPSGYRGVRRTNADASIHRADREFDERAELRTRADHERRVQDERQRADKIQQESASALREMRQSHDSAMQMLREGHQMQLDMMRQQMESMEKRFLNNQDAISKKPTEGELAIDFAKAQLNSRAADPEHMARVEQAAATQREQLMSQHRDELRHLRDDHAKEVERLQRQNEEDRRRGEERVESARKAIDERISEIQRQADQRVSEAEKRAEREVKYAKEEADRRVRDTENSYKARLEDLDRIHKRDLEAKTDTFTTRKESLESTHKTEMASVNAELSRLREENERLREENRKPLGERMQEFTENAEMMGFTKSDSEEKDWKSTLVETGMGLAAQIPQIVQSVQSTLASRQRPAQLSQTAAPQQLPPPVQGRGGGIAASRDVGGWATEDTPSDGDFHPDAYDPEVPGEVPSGPTMRPHFAPDSSEIAHPPAPPPAAPQDPPRPPAPSPPQQHPIVAQPSPQATPNPSPGTGVEVTDEQILQYSRGLSEAVEQGASAQQYYEAIKEQFGPEMVHAITHEITPQRISEVLQERDPTNSLLRRDGQQFMKEIWDLART